MNVGELRIRLESMDPEAEVKVKFNSGLYLTDVENTDELNDQLDDGDEFIIVVGTI